MSNRWEQSYLNLMQRILREGSRQKNRTGIDSFMIPGAMIQCNLEEGFPAVTTKQLFFGAVKGELLGFLRGYTSAAQFRELGCKIWDQNANENEAWLNNPARLGADDLGYIYSRLWTDMPHDFYDVAATVEAATTPWNQIQKLIEEINSNPTSRRLIVSSWHPEVFHRAALPPCHVLFQCIIDQEAGKLHLDMYQRSCDMFLGVPFNIASYATLTHLIAAKTGYSPGTFTWFGADCHVYENHVDQVLEQCSRDPLPSPSLHLGLDKVSEDWYLGDIGPQDIILVDYQHLGPIRAPMAV